MKRPESNRRQPGVEEKGRPKWPRMLIAAAAGLTLLQTAAFAWLSRIPDPLRGFLPETLPGRSLAQAPAAMTMLLACDGLRDAQAWLPNPRPFLGSRSSLGAPAGRKAPAQWELASRPAFRSPEYLPLTAAPPPLSPEIPRPAARPPEFRAPRPETPATGSIALNSLQIAVGGALKERALAAPVALAPWGGSDSLGVSRVELSVNADGEVILARLVESCGVKAADLQFLNACRAARFAPAGSPPPGREFSKLTRGFILVRWPAPPVP